MQFTNAFRDELDLRAHIAAAHSKNMTRAMAKAARVLDIDFNYGQSIDNYEYTLRGSFQS